MRNKNTARLTAILLLLCLSLTASPAISAITCQVSPKQIDINLTYHGATLTVTGESAPGDDLVIRIGNKAAPAHYKYIGKAGGIFWMKKGNITFKNVPGVYILASSGKLESILDPEAMKANLLGYAAIKATAEIEEGNPGLSKNEARWKNEFIRFKEKQNLYTIHPGTVTIQPGQTNTYRVEVPWPFQAPPGTYSIEAMAIRNGKVAERARTDFTVARTGMVAKLTDLAFNKPALYGIMAVVIAIIAGFAVGMIFKKGGGAH